MTERKIYRDEEGNEVILIASFTKEEIKARNEERRKQIQYSSERVLALIERIRKIVDRQEKSGEEVAE